MTEKTTDIQKRETKAPAKAERTRSRRTFIPPTDIYEKEDGLVLVADMPGVDENSVSVTLEDDVLTISGHVDEQKLEGYEPVYREYRVGDYERAFVLSEDVDRERIEATIKNGVLRLFLPKSETARPRKIAVKSG